MRLCDWCADCNNHPCGKSAPSHPKQRQANPRGIPRRPLLSDRSDRSDRSDTSVTPPQHAYRRNHQTSLAYPNGTSSPEPNQTAPTQTHGVYRGAPYPSHKSHSSHKSHASATPPQHAHHRCHKKARHTPAVNLPPSQTKLRCCNPPGLSHGLPRRSPSGRRRAHPSCQTGQTGQTQAPHPRTPHTAVAITLPGIPHR